MTAMLSAAALLVLALGPGIYAWYSSRKLLARIDDPLLPELSLAHGQRVGTAAGLSIGIGIVLVRDFVLLLLALVFLSVQVGGFSARRRIFEERWSLPGYLGHSTRFWLGALGSILLVATIPSIVTAVSVSAGIGVGVLALVWALEASFVFRRLVRARPLRAPEVEAALPAILERAKCEPPLLFEAEAAGGRWVNAFALPSMRRGAVVFTGGLLDALSARETAAIFAHEIAHLEHFTRKKVALGLASTALLVVLAVLIWGGPLGADLRGWEWVWPVTVLGALIFRAAKHRAHEGESDLRALELCRDPEALVSGLTKLHVLNRVPRRWDGSFEKMSSHPSLARRIHAIRRAAAAETEPEAFEEVYRSADGSRSALVFDAERIHWLEGAPDDDRDLLASADARRSLRYSDLRDLRLEHRSEGDVLTFTDSEGKTTRMPVSSGDVPSLQALLDRLDSFVGYAPTGKEPPTGRIWSVLLFAFSAASSWSLTVLVLALAVIVRPGVATLTALGAGALVAALFPPFYWPSLLMAPVALVCLFLAWKRWRLEPTPVRTDVLIGTLVPLALVLLSLVGALRGVLSPLPMMQLHSWATTQPSFFAGVLSMAAVLVTLRKKWAYACVGVLAAAAGLFLVLGSSPFRHRFSEDVFARAGDAMPRDQSQLEPIRSVVVPGGVFQLTLSPAGTRVAGAVIAPDSERRYTSDVFVERAESELDSFRAIAFGFLDEERLLVLDQDAGRAVLQSRDVGTGATSPVARDLPLLAGTKVDSDGDLWWVIGADWDTEEHVVIRGAIGSGEWEEIRLDVSDWSASLAVHRAGWALGPEYDVPDFGRWSESFLPATSWLLFSLNPIVVSEMRLSRPGEPAVAVGNSMLTVSCFAASSELRFFCSASEAKATSLWAFDPEARSWASLGSLGEFLYPDDSDTEGRLVLNGSAEGPVLVDLEQRRAARLVFPDEDETALWGIVAARGSVVARAVSTEEGDETRVTLYKFAW